MRNSRGLPALMGSHEVTPKKPQVSENRSEILPDPTEQGIEFVA